MGQTERRTVFNSHLQPLAKIQKGHSLADSLRIGKGNMGDHRMDYRHGHKSPESSIKPVHGVGIGINGTIIKRITAMAEAKTILMFLDFLGVPVFAYAFLINLGDVKGYVLFSIAVLYGIARLVFYVIKGVQDAQLRRLDIREREIDVDEREDRHEV